MRHRKISDSRLATLRELAQNGQENMDFVEKIERKKFKENFHPKEYKLMGLGLLAPNKLRTSSIAKVRETEKGRFSVTNYNRQISKGYRQEKGIAKKSTYDTKYIEQNGIVQYGNEGYIEPKNRRNMPSIV